MDAPVLLVIKLVSLIAVIVIGLLIVQKRRLKVNLFIIGGYVAVLAILTVICYSIPASALKTAIGPARNIAFYQSAKDLGANLLSGKL